MTVTLLTDVFRRHPSLVRNFTFTFFYEIVEQGNVSIIKKKIQNENKNGKLVQMAKRSFVNTRFIKSMLLAGMLVAILCA